MLQSLTSFWRGHSNKSTIKEMALGSAWVLMGNGLARILTLAGSVIVARALGKEIFGEYSLAINTLNLLAEAATFGAGTAGAKYISETLSKDKIKVAQSIVCSCLVTFLLALIVAVTLIVGGDQIANSIFRNTNMTPCLNAVALGLVAAGITGTLNSILSGLKKFRLTAVINIASCFVLFSLQAIAAFSKSLLVVTYATACGYIIVCIVTAYCIHKELIKADIKLHLGIKVSTLQLLYRYNLPAFISGMTVVPTTWAANLLLARQNQGYEELAIYSVANQWRNILLFIPITIASVALPILSGQSKQDANKLLFFSLSLNAAITFTTCALVYPFIPYILAAYGKGFSTGIYAFTGMLLVVFLISINSALSTYLTSQNRFWSGSIMNCLWAICFLALCQWLIPSQKALGLIYAYAGSYCFHLIIQTLQTVYIYGKQTHSHH